MNNEQLPSVLEAMAHGGNPRPYAKRYPLGRQFLQRREPRQRTVSQDRLASLFTPKSGLS